MPTPVARTFLGIGALVATLMLVGAGAGLAVAEPGDESGNTTETDPGEDPGNVATPEPTPTATTVPRTLTGELRRILRHPLSVFGNGRRPGEAPSTAPRTGSSVSEPTTRVKKKPVAPAEEEPVEQVITERPPPDELAPSQDISTAEVRLPFVAPLSVPVLTFPGTGGARQWSVDLTSPTAAYGSVEQTFATFNSLMVDAYAPFDPFPDPEPPPGPAFRITQEEPIADAGGGDIPMSGSSEVRGLPTIEAPLLVPRVATPRVPESLRGVAPAPSEALAGGSAGVPTPGLRGSVTAAGPGERVASAAGGQSTPLSNPAMRQGYNQYLRTARLTDVALVALPGVIGLLAITASGGLIGYRQANSTRYLHEEAVRFLR